MQETRKFAFDVGITFLASLINMLFGFIITILLGRFLGPEDLGLYKITFTLYGIIILFAMIGIPAAMVKYVAEFKEDRNKINQIVSSGIITSLFLGVGFVPLVYFLSDILAKIYNMPELSGLLKIMSFIFPFALVSGTLNGLLNGLREMKKIAEIVIIQSILMIFVTVPLIYYGFGVTGALIGVVLSSICSCLVLIYVSKKYFEITLYDYVKTTKMMLQFGFKVFATGLIGDVNNRVDIILIGFFLASTDIGYYAVAVNLSSFFWLIPSSIQRITYPATSAYWSENNHIALNNMLNKSMKYCTIILVLTGLGVGFFAQDIITIIFKKEFVSSTLPLQILLIGTVIRGSIIIPIGSSFAGIGRPGIDLKIIAIIAIINLILDIILIPQIGIAGAAIAATISLSVGAFVGLYLVIKFLRIKIDISWFLKIFGIVPIAIFLFKFGIFFINPFLLGGAILIGYSILIFEFFLTKEDKNLFKYLIRLAI
ncbi:Stage V sporulation protein B [Methanosarcinales archaeon]|nr:Stage V sporulation protein B [Methanosarcinales archaeon]